VTVVAKGHGAAEPDQPDADAPPLAPESERLAGSGAAT
jgi:hypothetical protein